MYSFWLNHSAWLGLRENFAKAQFFHRSRAGRARLAQFGLPSSSGITVLGVYITDGNLRRHTSAKEKKRLGKGLAVVAKCRFLPGHFSKKTLACSMASCSVAAWGWLQRAPPKESISQLECAWRKAIGVARVSSPWLVQLVLGHGTSLRFVAGCQAFCAILRMARREGSLALDWNCSVGLVARLRAFLVSIALVEVSAWLWRGPPLLGRLSLDPRHHAFYRDSRAAAHFLREAWRSSCWSHARSGRLDAAIGPYFAPRVKVVQQWVSTLDRHALAILTGGYVSHARCASLSGLSVSCVHCGLHDGTREHTWWHCPVVGVRSVPASPAQRLLGWPSGVVEDESVDLTILRALAALRVRELDLRYGRSGL